MKTKQIILTITLLFVTILIKAQDKYEFMVVEYQTGAWEISVAIDGKAFQQEKASFSDQEKSRFNANPFLKKVKEFQDKDWEVMSFNLTGENYSHYYCFLRKKTADKK